MRIALLGLALLALTGCRAVEYDPSVFEKKSFAVVSYFGPRNIKVETNIIGGFQGFNAWGENLLDEAGREEIAIVTKTLPGCEVPKPDTLLKSSGYQGLAPGFRPADKTASLPGLRPIPTGIWNVDNLDLGGLAKVAQDLQVDGVVLVEVIDWVVTDKFLGSSQRGGHHGQVKLCIVIVGADGKRLWKQGVQLDGPVEELSWAAVGRQLSGSSDQKTAVGQVHAAVVAALERFVTAWNAKGEP